MAAQKARTDSGLLSGLPHRSAPTSPGSTSSPSTAAASSTTATDILTRIRTAERATAQLKRQLDVAERAADHVDEAERRMSAASASLQRECRVLQLASQQGEASTATIQDAGVIHRGSVQADNTSTPTMPHHTPPYLTIPHRTPP